MIFFISIIIIISTIDIVYGEDTVNINDTEVSSYVLTWNTGEGSIPVYLQIGNETDITLTDDVAVTCVISQSDPGYTDVTFTPVVIAMANGSITADVTFIMVAPGWPVTVSCSGEYGDSSVLFETGTTLQLQVTTPPIVSICDTTIYVWSVTSAQYQTFSVELSETAVDYDVTVTCAIVDPGVTGAMVLNFVSATVSVGYSTADLPYLVTANDGGDSVTVDCSAQSTGGNQYLSVTSVGGETTFTSKSISVSFEPSPWAYFATETLTLYLTLSETIPSHGSEYIFTCAIEDVATTDEAELILDSGICYITATVTPGPTTTIEPVTYTNTTAPVLYDSDTDTDTDSDVNNNTITASGWSMSTSDYTFGVGDLYKTFALTFTGDMTVKQQGLFSIQCCTSSLIATTILVYDLAPSKYTNSSYMSDEEDMDTETTYSNPGYVEISTCPCDMTDNQCDIYCCCDTDCSDTDMELFQCVDGVYGGWYMYRVNEHDCEYVDYHTGIGVTPEYNVFLCVYLNNTNFLGYYYSIDVIADSSSAYTSYLSVVDTSTMYSYVKTDDSVNTVESSGSTNVVGYTQGISIKSLTDTGMSSYVTLPQPMLNGGCSFSSPIGYLTDMTSSCEIEAAPSVCSKVSSLSAFSYVTSTSLFDPACPTFTGVLAQHQGSVTIPVYVEYYCVSDTSDYLMDNTDTGSTGTDGLLGSLDMDIRTTTTTANSTSSSRCYFDDGFTSPPPPTYVSDTGICSYSVLDVTYDFTWNGTSLIELTAVVLMGDIALGIDENYTVFDYTAGTDSRVVDGNMYALTTTNAPNVPDNTTSPVSTATPIVYTYNTIAPPSTPDGPSSDNTNSSTVLNFIQKFSVVFTHEIASSLGDSVSSLSGNPGYVDGKAVLSGVGVSGDEFYATTVATVTSPSPNATTTGESVVYSVDTVVTDDEYLLKVWKTDSTGLCSDVTMTGLLFGVDVLSGCVVYISLSDLNNCTTLRDKIQAFQQQLVPSDYIGKTGDSDSSVLSDWLEIIIGSTDDNDMVSTTTATPTTSTPTTSNTTSVDIYSDYFTGSCTSIPSGLDITILYSKVGEYYGVTQREIIGAKISYSYTTWSLDCSGGTVDTCITDSNSTQSFVLTSSVQFIEVPLNGISARASGDLEYLCKNTPNCWQELYYPLRRPDVVITSLYLQYQMNIVYTMCVIFILSTVIILR